MNNRNRINNNPYTPPRNVNTQGAAVAPPTPVPNRPRNNRIVATLTNAMSQLGVGTPTTQQPPNGTVVQPQQPTAQLNGVAKTLFPNGNGNTQSGGKKKRTTKKKSTVTKKRTTKKKSTTTKKKRTTRK